MKISPEMEAAFQERIGEQEQPQTKPNGNDKHAAPLVLAPWWRDPATIPRRQFLFGRHYIRGEVGATIGAGGRAKTTLGTAETVLMAVGRDMEGNPLPDGPLRVWCLNAEEDQDELDRRFAAACQHYNITEVDLNGRLFVQSVRNKPWRIATVGKKGLTIDYDVVERMRDFIVRNRIDVLTIDPLISFHSVNESTNADMDLVIKEALGGIARATKSSVEVFHHPGKPKPGFDTTVDDSRGASAIINAARSARVLNFMTPAEASKLGIPEDMRRRYIRVTNGKANMGPVGTATWTFIEIEIIANGDAVACASSWTPQNPFEGITTQDVKLAQQVAQSGAYRADNRSPDWYGFALGPRLGIFVKHGGDNAPADMARLKTLIKKWLETGVLLIDEREDFKARKKFKIIIPGEPFHETVLDDNDDNLL